jgi:hypothetical protein
MHMGRGRKKKKKAYWEERQEEKERKKKRKEGGKKEGRGMFGAMRGITEATEHLEWSPRLKAGKTSAFFRLLIPFPELAVNGASSINSGLTCTPVVLLLA